MEACVLTIAAGVVAIAAVIRGYTGFGFSMITVVSLSQAMPPVDVIPVILLLEVAASLWLLPKVWRRVHWASVAWLLAGVAFGTPLGVHLLTYLPERPMRMVIALVVMVMTVGLWRGAAFHRMPGRWGTATVGFVSGVLNGATTVGGPPVILFYFSTPAGAVVSRASIIVYFLMTDLLAFAVCLIQGLVRTETLHLALVLILPLAAGLTAGSRLFTRSKAEEFRRKVLFLLMVIAAAAFIRAAWE